MFETNTIVTNNEINTSENFSDIEMTSTEIIDKTDNIIKNTKTIITEPTTYIYDSSEINLSSKNNFHSPIDIVGF